MLLAIDTSTRWVGLALYDGAQVFGETVWQSQSHHTIEVAPAVESLMARSGVKPADLNVIAAALGPGSFTSLRIGLGLAKGLALSLGIPIVGIPTLDFLAFSQPVRDLPMAAVLQAGRDRLAVGWYKVESGSWTSYGELQVLHIEELAALIHKPTLVIGELTAEERQTLARKRKNVVLASPAHSLRRPGFLAEMAWRRWQQGAVDEPVSLAPLYLHVAEAIPE
jgi:tRNA threonylcarbamoyladenosine biosynthesis protein TsaB